MESERVTRLADEIRELTHDEKEDLLELFEKEARYILAETHVERWLSTDAEIKPRGDDLDIYISEMATSISRAPVTSRQMAKAYRNANRRAVGPVLDIAEMRSLMDRFSLWKEHSIVLTGFDAAHTLVYVGQIKSEPDILSKRLKDVADSYQKTIGSMIFVMYDRELHQAMTKKLAKGLFRRLSLALKSVGYDLEDLLVTDGSDLVSMRQFSL